MNLGLACASFSADGVRIASTIEIIAFSGGSLRRVLAFLVYWLSARLRILTSGGVSLRCLPACLKADSVCPARLYPLRRNQRIERADLVVGTGSQFLHQPGLC